MFHGKSDTPPHFLKDSNVDPKVATMEGVGVHFVATLALGLWPKQRFAKVRAKNEAWESHFMLPVV
jgi:hypothetical protein